MPELTARPMTEAEYAAWEDALIESYAADQVSAGTWPAETAVEQSRQGNAELLPEGRDTADMLFLTAENRAGDVVGGLWITLVNPRGTPDCAFIYDIEVQEPFRGRGYGRALLSLAAEAVLQRGVHSIMLNVFAENRVAVGLYETSGYGVVTQQMRKYLT